MSAYKYILIVLLIGILTAGTAQAQVQIEKRSMLINAQGSFSAYRGDLYGDPDEYYVINLELNYQRFFWQGVTLGVDLVYDLESIDNNTNRSTVGFGPIGGIYFGSVESSFITYFQSSVIFGKIQGGSPDRLNRIPDKSLLRPSFAVGILYLISDDFAVNGGLKYSLNITDADGSERLSESRLGFQLGLNLFLF